MAVSVTPGDPYVPPLDQRTGTSGASHCPPNWTANQKDFSSSELQDNGPLQNSVIKKK
jgi:hypothetical protein